MNPQDSNASHDNGGMLVYPTPDNGGMNVYPMTIRIIN